MRFFDFLFSKKEDVDEQQEVQDHGSFGTESEVYEKAEVNKKKNIIKTKCHCGHKKAKLTSAGLIQCRKCKTIIGRAG